MEEKFTIEDAINIFKSRIIELQKFEEVNPEEITGQIFRGRARMGVANLKLNKQLLANYETPSTDKLS